MQELYFFAHFNLYVGGDLKGDILTSKIAGNNLLDPELCEWEWKYLYQNLVGASTVLFIKS